MNLFQYVLLNDIYFVYYLSLFSIKYTNISGFSVASSARQNTCSQEKSSPQQKMTSPDSAPF
jgi:hypothetical protein